MRPVDSAPTHREALLRLNPVTRFSYCTETIIQAGNKRLAIASIPIRTNAKTRESRLFKRSSEHVLKSSATIVRAYVMYRPLPVFLWTAGLLFVAAMIPFVRYLILLWFTSGSGGSHHIQSLVIGSVLMIASILAFALGVLADLIRINRMLIEDSLEQQKRQLFSTASDAVDARSD